MSLKIDVKESDEIHVSHGKLQVLHSGSTPNEEFDVSGCQG